MGICLLLDETKRAVALGRDIGPRSGLSLVKSGSAMWSMTNEWSGIEEEGEWTGRTTGVRVNGR